ncbi:MAG: PD40 domain-containing protein [Rhodothermales bacterium]|nr:PD40 domain-containing protein [Rhodothermales bacterium]
MSLDVSPDGRTIVFDMMGDLYTIPIGGGTATAITSGPAWDVQPSFSPDGSRIAFTSDRAGGDNIWTVAADGSDARQVTKETFRLLNGPAWTPDGNYILARKHFTSTRSLGAGEIWMYHASGEATAGLQITKRKNDQQDQGNEIALSPDGRYIYWSEDMSGGSTFQYSKDPNGQIYVIRRLDRESGRVDNYITGAGGSARATPSPDGKTIAFVRRVREKSTIHLFDTETGRQWQVFDGLNRDQQEAWAIFGVYPRMDWTPDGRSLVFWAGGGFHRLDFVDAVDFSGGETVHGVHSEIPFEVELTRTLHEALRVPVTVHEDSFTSRMIRDVATSPDGSTIVFHAAGYLYIKRMPDGTPRRLTSQTDHWEYDPAFSPDGRTIVYTTWSDEDYATIRRIAAGGGQSQPLTRRPGHYFEPRFSPDGAQIVFRRGGGSALRGRLHGMDTGIYRLNLSGGAPVLVTRSGSDARFGPRSTRIYFASGGGLSKSYRSVNLHGGDERTHFTMTYGANLVPSPDFEWVAFNELHNAYVAAFPRTGGEVSLNKDTKAVPVKQVTRDVGTDLHWSADSKSLHWVTGPEYFTRSLANSFSFMDGAPEELPAVDTTGVAVGLTLTADKPSGVTAITGARIITMRGDEIIEDGTVLVRDNRIEAVGTNVDVPAGATVIDAAGRTVLPGFVDAHAHASHFFSGPTPQESWVYSANLAFGVTTTHDPSANTETVFTLSEMVKAGRILGPRVFSTGTILYGADGDFKAVVNSLEDARSHVRRMKAVGAVSVKSYNQPRRDQRQQVMQAAREYGLNVVPEGGSTFQHNMTMIIDGHTGIEHNVPIAPLYRDVLETWRHSATGYTPTLVVVYGGPSGERWFYQHDNVWENERLLRYTPRDFVDPQSRRRWKSAENEYYHDEVAADARKLIRQGNLVQVGSHGQMQGLAFHWEMRMLEQGGFTPHEALRSATLHGARYLGMDGDIGSLEPGKLADLILVEGDPLTRLEDAENVTHVMVNGRLYDATELPRGARADSW